MDLMTAEELEALKRDDVQSSLLHTLRQSCNAINLEKEVQLALMMAIDAAWAYPYSSVCRASEMLSKTNVSSTRLSNTNNLDCIACLIRKPGQPSTGMQTIVRNGR